MSGPASPFALRLLEELRRSRLLEGARRVLVGVSGGADSVALLLLLLEASQEVGSGFPELIVGHVHHGLRGPAADRDARFVEHLAAVSGAPFLLAHVQAAEAARPLGQGIEAAARLLRYDVFRGWALERSLDGVALAHHRGDQAETVLLRVSRGAGARGLAGIPRSRRLFPRGPGQPSTRVIRPLLGWRREELRAYLRGRGAEFVVDDSNEDRSVARSYLRHEVLPRLEEGVHPGASRGLVRAASHARRWRRDLSILGRRLLHRARIEESPGHTDLRAASLRLALPSVLHETLRRALESLCLRAVPGGAGPASVWIPSRSLEAVRALLRGGRPVGRVALPREATGGLPCEAELRYGILRLRARSPGEGSHGALQEPGLPPSAATTDDPGTSWAQPGLGPAPLLADAPVAWGGWTLHWRPDPSGPWAEALARGPVASGPLRGATMDPAVGPAPFEARAGSRALLERVDSDALESAGRLSIRAPRPGDLFHPLGAPGRKGLKEVFREARIWPESRASTPLVVAGDEIAWVVGHRIGERFRVTGATRRVGLLAAVAR